MMQNFGNTRSVRNCAQNAGSNVLKGRDQFHFNLQNFLRKAADSFKKIERLKHVVMKIIILLILGISLRLSAMEYFIVILH